VPSAHLSAQLSFESAIRSHEAKWDRATKKRLVREDRTDEFPGRRALFIFSSTSLDEDIVTRSSAEFDLSRVHGVPYNRVRFG